ncbi:MAG: hypothetical protein AABX63_01035 [Nanoarchaeota archaeon]
MANEIGQEYAKLSKKYKLPKFKDIDDEFEISSLDNEKFLIKNILRSISEKLEFYIEVIGSLVHPDGSSISSMYEIRFFTEDEKNGMYNLFKRLMKTDRNVIELVLKNDEKEQVDFLNKFFSDWLNLKKELLKYIEKMKESWEKQSTIEEDIGYFG